jgi:hypothetical protein
MASPALSPLAKFPSSPHCTTQIHFGEYRIEDTLTEPINHEKISTDVK